MGTKYDQLSLEERCDVARLHSSGCSIRQIAAALDRSASSISRELKRNWGQQIGYKPVHAQERAKARRWKGSKLERNGALREEVLACLREGWSPEQACGWIERQHGCKLISTETIYRFIYDQIARHKDYSWRHYLPRGKSKLAGAGAKGVVPRFISTIASPLRSVLRRLRIVPSPAIGRPISCSSPNTARPSSRCTSALHASSSRQSRREKRPSPSPTPLAACSNPCRQNCANPSPSTTGQSLRAITSCTVSPSQPSSAIPTHPGKRAESRTPSDACEGPFHEKPIWQHYRPNAWQASSVHTTTHPENALTGKLQQSSSASNCCTSNVNPPSRFRGNDISKLLNSARSASPAPDVSRPRNDPTRRKKSPHA